MKKHKQSKRATSKKPQDAYEKAYANYEKA